MFVPLLKALTSCADALGPIADTKASELLTNNVFRPAFVSCPLSTAPAKAIPPTCMPAPIASASASSKFLPLLYEHQNVIATEMPPL